MRASRRDDMPKLPQEGVTYEMLLCIHLSNLQGRPGRPVNLIMVF